MNTQNEDRLIEACKALISMAEVLKMMEAVGESSDRFGYLEQELGDVFDELHPQARELAEMLQETYFEQWCEGESKAKFVEI